jgi:hypothetical protein
MKRVILSNVAAVVLLGLTPVLGAQEGLPPQLVAAREAVARELGEQAPGWLRRPVPPMEGSSNTVVDQWELGDFVVKVTITAHDSREEAADSVKKGKHHLEVEEAAARARGRSDFRLIKEELTDVAEGGYAWQDAYGATAVAFRESNLTVYVSVVRPELNKDDRLSKEFAKHVAKALRSL